jgi:hypothetical protein
LLDQAIIDDKDFDDAIKSWENHVPSNFQGLITAKIEDEEQTNN